MIDEKLQLANTPFEGVYESAMQIVDAHGVRRVNDNIATSISPWTFIFSHFVLASIHLVIVARRKIFHIRTYMN